MRAHRFNLPRLATTPGVRCGAALLAMLVVMAASGASADVAREWRFRVLLDGSPIGSQSFRVTPEGEGSRVSIDASFDVKFLFLTAYSYRHHNEEVWDGNCLRSIEAATDDNGKKFKVSGTKTDEAFKVVTATGQETLPSCVVSFAYWAPERLGAARLLNSQTGEYEPVTMQDMGEESRTLRGQPVTARRVALQGPKLQIDLWYTADNDWVALESTTTSGRRLRYDRE